MTLLESIRRPEDLKRLDPEQLPQLAGEIRDLLVSAVSKNGGHLGPNLGAVELTIAMHRVFDSPRDRILFDTGHQAYVHKLLTGRHDFGTLRQRGGLSGYPSQAESEHDVIENSHASTALSYADGLAKAFQLRGEGERFVVPFIGDGALTGGMAWEALNNIAAGTDRRVDHRRQRQRPLLLPDDRRAGQPPRRPAHDPRLRARPRPDQAHRAQDAGRRRDGLRRAARHQEGHQGHPAAAGDVRGPRPEVRRPDRRPRRGGRGARAPQGQGVRRPGHRALHDPARGTATRRPRTTRRSAFHSPGPVRPGHRPQARQGRRRSWTKVFSDELVQPRRRAARHRRDHRRHAAPHRARRLRRGLPRAHLRRRHRRAARA